MKLNFSKKVNIAGFTLVELIVVIAIIGVLASIIIASLANSRISAADASIKANLVTIRSEAALYFDTYASYSAEGGVNAPPCSKLKSMFHPYAIIDPVFQNAIGAISTANGGFQPTCVSSANSWVVVAQLKSGGFWCVDYTGTFVPEGSSSSYNSTFNTCN